MEQRIHRFGEFELDERLYELRRAGRPIKLEPKVYDVLAYLVRHRDRVVSKDELLDRLWPGEAVSESVLPTNVAAVRRALREGSGGADAIRTVHGRGYRFVAPVEELSAASPSTSGPSAQAPARPFVGRESAMGTLRTALDEAAAGRGRLLLLVGEPGIGKTRTADELAREARARGARVLAGRCYEGEGAPAYWPWVQILRESLSERGGDALAGALGPAVADVAELVPELRERLPAHEAAPAVSPEQARFRLFDAVARFLRREAEARPLVVTLDDLHWADKPTLLLLQFVARALGEAPLLVVGAYRDVELRRDHPLAAVLGELAREPHCERVLLRGLGREDVARLLEASGHRVEAPLIDALWEMTEGNPFFLGEIVQLWAAEGAPRRTAERRFALPQGVREAIGRRLDGLSEPCNRLLRIASVMGREFRLRELAHVAELTPDAALERLEEAEAAHVAVPTAPGAYAFTHLLVRETLYDEITTPERVRLHRRAAEALESLYGSESDARVSELAHHLFEAVPGGDVEKAVSVGERAAARASRVLAWEDAAVHLGRALLALDQTAPVDEERRCGLLLALADAQDHAAEFEASRRSARRAFEIARDLGRPDLLTRGALAISGRFDLGPPYDYGCAALEEALAALGESEPDLRARLLARLAVTPPYRNSMERRLSLVEDAVALAREGGDPEVLLVALASLGYPGLLGPDHDERRLQVAAEVEELARRTGRRDMLARVHEDRMRSYLAVGDIEAAAEEVEAGRRLAKALREPALLYFGSFFDVARAIAEARFDEAEREIRASHARAVELVIGPEQETTNIDGIFMLQVFCLLRAKGELERFPPDIDYAPYPRFPGPIVESIRALGELRAGDPALARREYEQIVRAGLAGIPRDEWWLATLGALVDLAVAFDDAETAGALYEMLLPYADRNLVYQVFRVYDGSVSRFLGRLAEVRGDLDTAVRHLEAAAEHNARMGARAHLAWTWLDLARVRRARGEPGDGEAAAAALERALAVARECGMGGLLRSAEALAG